MFTQPDALTGNLGDPRTMTSYNYGGGDPINQADASGYFFDDIIDGLGEFAKSGPGDLILNFGESCFNGAVQLGSVGAIAGTALLPGLGTGGGAALFGTFGCLGGVLFRGITGDTLPLIPTGR